MRLAALMLLSTAIWLGSTVPAWAQTQRRMGSSCAGSSASGSSAMSLGGTAGFSAFNANPGTLTNGLNLGIGTSSMMAGGFSPNLNFTASNGMFGGFNASTFAQGNNGLGGFNNGFGTGAMDGTTGGPTVWNDGFNSGFNMGAMFAQNNGMVSRNESDAIGSHSTNPDAAVMRAAQARSTTKASALRMRAAVKRSKSRAKTTRREATSPAIQ